MRAPVPALLVKLYDLAQRLVQVDRHAFARDVRGLHGLDALLVLVHEHGFAESGYEVEPVHECLVVERSLQRLVNVLLGLEVLLPVLHDKAIDSIIIYALPSGCV